MNFVPRAPQTAVCPSKLYTAPLDLEITVLTLPTARPKAFLPAPSLPCTLLTVKFVFSDTRTIVPLGTRRSSA